MKFFSIIKQTFLEIIEDDVLRLAAAVGFYAALSLAPTVIIGLNLAGRIWGAESARDETVRQVEHLIGFQGAHALGEIMEQADEGAGRGAAAVLGIITLVFAATAVFAALQDAMNVIWGVEVEPGRQIWHFIRKRLISLGMLLAVAFLMLISLVLSMVINLMMRSFQGTVPGTQWIWTALNFGSSLIIFTLLFALIFKVLPDAQVAWKDVWIGAAVTAGLFAIGRELIGLYLGRSVLGSAYGAASSLMVVLLWVYYSSFILFVGAEFTQVFARLRGHRIEPEDYAVSADESSDEGRSRA